MFDGERASYLLDVIHGEVNGSTFELMGMLVVHAVEVESANNNGRRVSERDLKYDLLDARLLKEGAVELTPVEWKTFGILRKDAQGKISSHLQRVHGKSRYSTRTDDARDSILLWVFPRVVGGSGSVNV